MQLSEHSHLLVRSNVLPPASSASSRCRCWVSRISCGYPGISRLSRPPPHGHPGICNGLYATTKVPVHGLRASRGRRPLGLTVHLEQPCALDCTHHTLLLRPKKQCVLVALAAALRMKLLKHSSHLTWCGHAAHFDNDIALVHEIGQALDALKSL